jgi:hypothetical protein
MVDSVRIHTDEAVVWVRTLRRCPITPMTLGHVVFIEVARLPRTVQFVEQTENAPECTGGF